jgi:hypothetical protein
LIRCQCRRERLDVGRRRLRRKEVLLAVDRRRGDVLVASGIGDTTCPLRIRSNKREFQVKTRPRPARISLAAETWSSPSTATTPEAVSTRYALTKAP